MNRITATIAAAGLAASLAACGSAEAPAQPAAAPTSATTQSAPGTIDWSKSKSGGVSNVAESPTGVPTPTAAPLSAADLKLGVKLREKKCFGSAGCNLTFIITADLSRPEALGRGEDYDITYEVSGLEDNSTQIGTFTLKSDGSMNQREQVGFTDSGKSKLAVKVVDVATAS